MTNWQRRLIILAIAGAVLLAGLVLAGCANTPVQRATDTPAFALREGQSIVLQIKSADEIAERARNSDSAYRVDAIAFMSGDFCNVWMKPGALDLPLLNHEMAHCAGLKHDATGRWLTK